MKKRFLGLMAAFGIASLLLAFGIACGGSSGGEDAGTLSLFLTDAPDGNYQAVYVTISEVHAKQGLDEEGGPWWVVAEPNQTYDLLELTNGVLAHLGLTQLPAGHYDQLRLIIGTVPDDGLNIFDEAHPYANYIVDSDGTEHELKIPSGIQTGIKLVAGFDIYGGQVTELILDFDAEQSVVKAGASGSWLLKPTIRVLGTTVVTISGLVTDETDGGSPLPGARISAQVYYPEDTYPDMEPEERVLIQASTISNDDGEYVLFAQPGDYTLVAYKDGYGFETSEIVAEPSAYYNRDFALSSVDTGTVSGSVDVDGAGEEQVVIISFRDSIGGVEVELQSVQVANGGSYAVILPAGEISVVASTEGRDSQVHDVTVVAGDDTVLDLDWL